MPPAPIDSVMSYGPRRVPSARLIGGAQLIRVAASRPRLLAGRYGAASPDRGSLHPCEIFGDGLDLLVGETTSYGTHDMRAVVAARAALEFRQLLHEVGLRLPGKTGIAFVAG